MSNEVLHWKCVRNCGACCKLDPTERQEALAVLNECQLKKYIEMVGEDGWCKYFDSNSRICRIYEERPDFCRVDNLPMLFEIPKRDLDSFAISCCHQQISSIYGENSIEKQSFDKNLRKSIKENG